MDPTALLATIAVCAVVILGLFLGAMAWAAARESARGEAELALETDRRERAEEVSRAAKAAAKALVERERARARGIIEDVQAHKEVSDALAGARDPDDAVERLLERMRTRARRSAAAVAGAAGAPDGGGPDREVAG